jgi:hypothetical protein
MYRELQASHPVENTRARLAGWISEMGRRARRMLRPTGMWVSVGGGTSELRAWLAHELAQRLAPAFRRTCILPLHAPGGAMKKSWHVMVARMQSSLVLSLGEESGSRRLIAPDIILKLDDHLQPEKVVHDTCQAVLQWLAIRTRRRLGLSNHSGVTYSYEATDRQLSAPGSD